MFLLQLVYYGDLVIPTSTWVSYAPQAKIIGRQIHLLPTSMESDWHLTAEQLEDLCKQDRGRPRIVILNYPSNTTGRTLSQERLKDLADVARKNRVVLLSDEIYGKLHHEGDHHSVASLYLEGTIFSGGLSKWCGAGGWRLGVPPETDRGLNYSQARYPYAMPDFSGLIRSRSSRKSLLLAAKPPDDIFGRDIVPAISASD